MSNILRSAVIFLLFLNVSSYASGIHLPDSLKSDSTDFVLTALRYGRVKAERLLQLQVATLPQEQEVWQGIISIQK